MDAFEEILKVTSVSKSYGKLKVIEMISFDLKKGESIALLGPSGCGKTTLIRIIAGLIDEYEGTVDNKAQRIGYVFQEPRLIPWRTVVENLKFVSEDEERIFTILDILKLRDFANYKPSKLSGGMRQRVNLARALMIQPELLLLDEPFASLDIHLKISIISDIIDRKKDMNFAMIVVTHDVREALLLADKIYVLSDKPSKIVEEIDVSGIPKNISNPEFYKAESEILSKILGRWSG
ncbi:NitT/TauT family transport system ATP-binding protein [Fervidobacterium changbaicum]|uniref:ABC transporter ATP-binding protein n=2 Tax=Fervidobacterium TaxID=2422 RepID=A0AAI8CKY7_FERIS|nr:MULTISPECIES: ABC transporter ATP-binding protein [Fervidobacterium]AMW32148.1 ABC transporter ATP-binding protein [Fervidobacterium islandicum]SDH55944.1 NitT/TauT family transport system ATP-binding protein [Fervidobacterium changbaicum]